MQAIAETLKLIKNKKILPFINSKAHTRDHRLIKSAIYSIASKLTGIAVSIVTIPLTLEYLGKELFGVWMLVTGILATISFADLGIGIGLQNGISKSFGLEDPKIARNYIKNAYITVFSLTSFFILLFLAILFAEKLIPPNLSISEVSTETKNALIAGVFLYLIGVPTSLIHRVLNGYQENHTTNILIIAGSLLSLIGIYASVTLDLGLMGVMSFFILAPSIVNAIYSIYFLKTRPNSWSEEKIDTAIIRKLINDGGWNLLAQLLYSVKTNAPPIIISFAVGVVAVGEYGIAQRVVSILGIITAVALQPLWSAYGEAYYRGDKEWITKSLKRSIFLVLSITIPSSVFFTLLGSEVIELWTSSSSPSTLLIAALSLWVVISNVNVCFAMFLNGIGSFKNQSIFSLLFIGAAIITSYFSGLAWGDAGVVIGFILIAELARMPLIALEVTREIRGMK